MIYGIRGVGTGGPQGPQGSQGLTGGGRGPTLSEDVIARGLAMRGLFREEISLSYSNSEGALGCPHSRMMRFCIYSGSRY
jgi:hypothetical protein